MLARAILRICRGGFSQMSMEGRMTVCNMSIEMGARGGMIAPDDTTLNMLKGERLPLKV